MVTNSNVLTPGVTIELLHPKKRPEGQSPITPDRIFGLPDILTGEGDFFAPDDSFCQIALGTAPKNTANSDYLVQFGCRYARTLILGKTAGNPRIVIPGEGIITFPTDTEILPGKCSAVCSLYKKGEDKASYSANSLENDDLVQFVRNGKKNELRFIMPPIKNVTALSEKSDGEWKLSLAQDILYNNNSDTVTDFDYEIVLTVSYTDSDGITNSAKLLITSRDTIPAGAYAAEKILPLKIGSLYQTT